MTSRRKRVRQRERLRKTEANAHPQKPGKGWGHGYPTSNSDLILLRQAVNADWDVPPEVRANIVRELNEELKNSDGRRLMAVVKCHLAIHRANLRVKTGSFGMKKRRGRPPKQQPVVQQESRFSQIKSSLEMNDIILNSSLVSSTSERKSIKDTP